MSDQPNEQNENPLDDLADELSEALTGQQVEINESSVGQVDGGHVQMRQSAARSVQASALSLDESAVGLARAKAIDVRDSTMAMAIADQAALHDVTVSVVAARRIDAQQVRAFAVFTPDLRGDVEAILTPITALIAGAGFAVTMFLLKNVLAGLGSLIFRRRRQSESD